MATPATDPDLLRARLERLRQAGTLPTVPTPSAGATGPGLGDAYLSTAAPELSGGAGLRERPVEPSSALAGTLPYPGEAIAAPWGSTAPLAEAAMADAERQGVMGSLGEIAADVLGNLNVGIVRTLGFPSDAINAVLGLDPSRSAIGSQGLQRGLAALNAAPPPGEEGEDFLSRTAQNVGSAALPFGGAAAAGARIAASGAPAVGGLAKAALTTLRHPIAAGAVELGGAAGAAGGGLLAERMAPDAPAARMVGELIGGMTGSGLTQALPRVSPMAIAARGVQAARRAAPFTGTGARARAARRLQSLVEDPQAAAARLEADDVLPGVSPAQRSGEPGLVALEREVGKKNLEIGGQLDRAQAATTASVREGLRFSGRPKAARRFLEDLVDEAATRARERLERLRPGGSVRDASVAARGAIDDAFGKAKVVETDLWGKVPQDVPVSLDRARNVLRTALSERTVADDPRDIPRFVTGLLGELDDAGELGIGKLGTQAELRAAHTLRSRVGRAAAAERAKDAPNRRQIRILSNLEAALLDDMAETDAGPALTEAIDFSRHLNERFRRGIVGEILGFEQTGEGRIAPESTLERALGRRGEAQGVATRELGAAAGTEPGLSESIRDFIRGRFQDEVVDPRTGRVNPGAAERFRQANRALLEEYPELRNLIDEAGQGQRRVDVMLGETAPGSQSASRRWKTATATYLEAPIEQEVGRVLRMQDPGRAMRALVREVQADQSGEALRGLKAAFGEHLIKGAETGADLADATPVLAGTRMRRLLSEHRTAAEALYSPEELRRLEKIVRTLERQDTARGRVPDIGGGVIKDMPSRLVDLVAGTLGARHGAKLGAGTSGASLLTAHFGAQRARELLEKLTNDQARDLLVGAVTDEKLMAALLRDQTKIPSTRRAADFRVLRAYLGVPASTAARGGEEERKEFPKNSTKAIRERLQRLQDPEEQGGDLPPSEPAAQREGAENDPHGIRQFLEALA